MMLTGCSSRSRWRTWRAASWPQACGSEAQAVALIDSWITALVRQRASAAALQLHLGLVPGFGVVHGFRLGLGFPSDPGGIFAAGLPFGFLRRDAQGGLVGLC